MTASETGYFINLHLWSIERRCLTYIVHNELVKHNFQINKGWLGPLWSEDRKIYNGNSHTNKTVSSWWLEAQGRKDTGVKSAQAKIRHRAFDEL